MTITPERYLLAARLKNRAKKAADMRPCRICGRLYMPGLIGTACSTTCIEMARQRGAGAR